MKSKIAATSMVPSLKATAKLILCMLCLVLPALAFAETTETLPYEKGLATLKESLGGTVPFAISLAGIVGCGAMLIFGGEISGFMRTMVFIVLVVAVIVQAGSIITMLGGGDGTAVGDGFAGRSIAIQLRDV